MMCRILYNTADWERGMSSIIFYKRVSVSFHPNRNGISTPKERRVLAFHPGATSQNVCTHKRSAYNWIFAWRTFENHCSRKSTTAVLTAVAKSIFQSNRRWSNDRCLSQLSKMISLSKLLLHSPTELNNASSLQVFCFSRILLVTWCTKPFDMYGDSHKKLLKKKLKTAVTLLS